jgi:hypothetical protein
MSDTERAKSLPPAEEIYRMIREAAYLKAEARNFAPGVELSDWLEAEREVMARLNGGNAPQKPD